MVEPRKFQYRKQDRASFIKHLTERLIAGYVQEIQDLNPDKDKDLKKLMRIIEVLRPVLSGRGGGRKHLSKREQTQRTQILREARTMPVAKRVSFVNERMRQIGLAPRAESTIAGWLGKKLS